MALIRYPGSKAKLVSQIVRWFPPETFSRMFNDKAHYEYREPFFGAGAIGFEILSRLPDHCSIWLNDKDPSMHALWLAVSENPVALQETIRNIKPTPELFYKLKEEDGRTDLPLCEVAARKLALHRMSYSGLGYMSGGPLGGRNQSSKYNVDCRWNTQTMEAEITDLHKRLFRFQSRSITCQDFSKLIVDAPADCFIYLDPPYFEKGPELYRYSMDEEDHHLLAVLLRDCEADWILSYDDHPEIRRLYSWAEIREVEIRYTMARAMEASRPKNQEILIRPTEARP